MVAEEMIAFTQTWICLQQPAHPACGLNASFRTLLAATDQGWELMGPPQIVLLDERNIKSFHVILVHKITGQTTQLHISATPDVERFFQSTGFEGFPTVSLDKFVRTTF